jgi:ATP-dependent DNA helicase RecG
MNGNISNLRNPVLGGVFFRLNLIEMFGTGIRRIKYAYRDSTLKPIFEVYENSIVISLPVTTTNLIMTQDETKIYNLLKDGSELSSGEMSKVLGFSRNKVVRVTGSLVNKRYIRVIGSGRGTRYSMQA